ncbi:MAG: hypothetical protein SGI83_15005 [Bacteroidota bacterium]|nr:hypothetical protein [Bacteroidota bacterium]
MKRSWIKTSASFFGFLCILFIPFPFTLIKAQLYLTDFLFGKPIAYIAAAVFGKSLDNTRVYSDSFSMYLLVLLLFVLSMLVSLLLLQVKKWALYRETVHTFFTRVFIAYLALQLLKYGIDKIFKNQFYLPEPNTLYTPLGQIDKDLLYWSSMGTSHFYSIFLGTLEAVAAVLILIRRTRLVGLLVSFAVLLNVVAVNFGFDISVKLFSLFLLYITLYLLQPYTGQLYQLLIRNKATPGKPAPEKFALAQPSFVAHFLKWFAIGIICIEVFYPFIKSGKLNGDNTARPHLHGVYEVRQVIVGTDTLAAIYSPVKRFFIHKESYMIFQDPADQLQDYKLALDKAESVFILTDYQLKQTVLSFQYQPADSTLTLQYFHNGTESRLVGKALDWKKLPLLQKSFHWTVEGNK